MGSIQTGIELNDGFTAVINNIISSVNLAVSAMYDMQGAMSADVDTSPLDGARSKIDQATMAVNELEKAISRVDEVPQVTPAQVEPPQVADTGDGMVVNVDPVIDTGQLQEQISSTPLEVRPEIQVNAPPEPVVVPVEWQTDNMEVFSSTGIDRFRQEVQSAGAMLEQLCSTQDAIAKRAYNASIFPPGAFRDLNTMAVRMDMIRDRIRQIENNPVNFGTDAASAELEQCRSQLAGMVQIQDELNEAVRNMDVSAANDAYLRLSATVSGTERYIRDNVDEQGRFNREVQGGVHQAGDLLDMVKGMAAAYVSIQGMGKAMGISDELVLTTSRLDMMNDGVQDTQELVNMVYAAAQDARGSFSEMSDVVARFGNNAKDAFSSSEEVVAFADLVQKQMTIAGAGTQEASNAMLQLSQALGSGVLRGDELNSIFEQAPNLIQSIADYLDVPIGQIREMASEGELSAGIVKAAIFASADEINEKFEQMPMTWGQTWQSMQNTALIAFQPVLQKLNDTANSDAFQVFADNAVEAMAVLAGILLEIFDLAVSAGSFMADNWSAVSPVIYGVIGALAAYLAISAVVAAINGVVAASHATKAAAEMMAAGATFVQTAAQHGLNAALAACPITWIIVLLISLVAIIFAVCNAIAKMTGVANSGFGIMTGGVNVVIQFFRNLGLTVADIALGIWNVLEACATNMRVAFHNAICSVQSWFYDLLAAGLTTIEGICVALNKLPFVEFDYSGISNAADDYAAKAAEAAGNKEEYKSISDAFNEGMSTYDTFQDGWMSDAFAAGAAWGDGIADAVGNFSLADMFGSRADIPDVNDYVSGFNDVIAAGVSDNLGSIAGDTGSIKDSLDCTEEDLKYLRDIAEQEAVNRYTLAEVKVEQTNHNNINNGMDLDGVVSGLTDAVNEAVDSITEGVHE